MKKVVPPTRTLNDRQRYLLQRIPDRYKLATWKNPPEPSAVKAARKLVTAWDETQRIESCKYIKRMEALIQKAREAVYFETEEKALGIVRQVEKLTLGSC
jgi:hypothetical protein